MLRRKLGGDWEKLSKKNYKKRGKVVSHFLLLAVWKKVLALLSQKGPFLRILVEFVFVGAISRSIVILVCIGIDEKHDSSVLLFYTLI